jgi:hypothetical protein
VCYHSSIVKFGKVALEKVKVGCRGFAQDVIIASTDSSMVYVEALPLLSARSQRNY